MTLPGQGLHLERDPSFIVLWSRGSLKNALHARPSALASQVWDVPYHHDSVDELVQLSVSHLWLQLHQGGAGFNAEGSCVVAAQHTWSCHLEDNTHDAARHLDNNNSCQHH